MSHLHPIFAQALAPFVHPDLIAPERLEAQVANAVRLFQAPPCPKGQFTYCADFLISGHEVVCHLDYEAAERGSWDEPGYPAQATLCAAYVRDVNVYDLMDEALIDSVEVAALLAFDELAEEAQAESKYEAEISRREYCEER